MRAFLKLPNLPLLMEAVRLVSAEQKLINETEELLVRGSSIFIDVLNDVRFFAEEANFRTLTPDHYATSYSGRSIKTRSAAHFHNIYGRNTKDFKKYATTELSASFKELELRIAAHSKTRFA